MTRRFDLKRSNCWHLVRDVWRDMTGQDLGDLTPARVHRGALNSAVDAAADGPGFQALDAPRERCLVLLRRRKDMPHVGVLLRGKLLHMTPEGVRHEPLAYAALGFSVVEFYVPRGTPETA